MFGISIRTIRAAAIKFDKLLTRFIKAKAGEVKVLDAGIQAAQQERSRVEQDKREAERIQSKVQELL